MVNAITTCFFCKSRHHVMDIVHTDDGDLIQICDSCYNRLHDRGTIETDVDGTWWVCDQTPVEVRFLDDCHRTIIDGIRQGKSQSEVTDKVMDLIRNRYHR